MSECNKFWTMWLVGYRAPSTRVAFHFSLRSYFYFIFCAFILSLAAVRLLVHSLAFIALHFPLLYTCIDSMVCVCVSAFTFVCARIQHIHVKPLAAHTHIAYITSELLQWFCYNCFLITTNCWIFFPTWRACVRGGGVFTVLFQLCTWRMGCRTKDMEIELYFHR